MTGRRFPGVAIGLATVIAEVYPVRGAAIRTLFLATLAVNQTVGPILFRLALVRSGEMEPTASDEELVAGTRNGAHGGALSSHERSESGSAFTAD